MIEWWNTLTAMQQIFFCIAIPSTLVLIIQTVLLLIGMGGHDADAGMDTGTDMDTGMDIDGDGSADGDASAEYNDTPDVSGMRLFTVRGFVSFFTVAGWLGVALLGAGMDETLAITFSIAAGVAALVLTAIAFRAMLRLQDSGNISIKNTVGKTASVYLRIPANRSGTGKVMVTVQERYSEFNAVTDADTELAPQQAVTVTGILDDDTVIVSEKTI